ncbi:unnamed protein product [Tenebrio molitor]|nr:unnamed protein product [Tenebrio molitor]
MKELIWKIPEKAVKVKKFRKSIALRNNLELLTHRI